MSDVRIYTTRKDSFHYPQPVKDITDGVRAMYDHLVASMDWGSGFLDTEEVGAVLRVALACDFIVPDTARDTFMEYAKGNRSDDEHLCVICGSRVMFIYPNETPWYGVEITGQDDWWHAEFRNVPASMAPPYYWAGVSTSEPRKTWMPAEADHEVRLWRES